MFGVSKLSSLPEVRLLLLHGPTANWNAGWVRPCHRHTYSQRWTTAVTYSQLELPDYSFLLFLSSMKACQQKMYKIYQVAGLGHSDPLVSGPSFSRSPQLLALVLVKRSCGQTPTLTRLLTCYGPVSSLSIFPHLFLPTHLDSSISVK